MSTTTRIDASPLLERIRSHVLVQSVRVFWTIGFALLLIRTYRDIQYGLGWNQVIPIWITLLVMGALPRLRYRGSVAVTSGIYLMMLLGISFWGICSVGLKNSSVAWLPLAATQAWILGGIRIGRIVTILAGGVYIVAVFLVVAHGLWTDFASIDTSKSVLYWVTHGGNYLIAGVMFFLSVRQIARGVIESEGATQADLERGRAVLEAIDDAVLLREIEQDAITEANDAGWALLGGRGREGGVHRIADLAGAGSWSSERLERSLAEAARSGSVFVWRCRSPSGRAFWAEFAVRSIDFGTRRRLLISIRDIDERFERMAETRSRNSRLERMVEQRTRLLDEAQRELSSFAYSAAHDLRAPLRAISGFATILREEDGNTLDAEDRERLEAIEHSALDLSNRIDALLSPHAAGLAPPPPASALGIPSTD